MTSSPQSDSSSDRERDDAELRNWMLPLGKQDFRVPSVDQFRIPDGPVAWSGRLFTLTRWFNRIASYVVVIALLVLAGRWVFFLLRSVT